MSSLFCHSWQFWFWFWFCVEPSTTVLVLILEFVKMCIFKLSLRDLHALNDQLWVQMWWWRRTGHPGIESSGLHTFSASESHFIHLYSIVSSTDLQIGRICALLWLLLKQINVPVLSCLVLCGNWSGFVLQPVSGSLHAFALMDPQNLQVQHQSCFMLI